MEFRSSDCPSCPNIDRELHSSWAVGEAMGNNSRQTDARWKAAAKLYAVDDGGYRYNLVYFGGA
jgi:hypothetical protein